MKRLFYSFIIGALVSTLAIGAEVRKLGEYDLSWGPYGTTWTSPAGKVVRYLPRYFDNNAFADNTNLYGKSLTGDGTGSITGFNIPLYITQSLSVLDAVTVWADVRAYGAKGDGVTDDTAAIQAAIDAVYAMGTIYQFVGTVPGSGTVSNSTYIGSLPKVYFPKGKYKISSSLISKAYVKYEGEHSTIFSNDNTIDLVTNVQYMNSFKGISFTGGARGIYIQTSNLDTTIISVDDCEFREQHTAMIAADNTSQSTTLSVTNSKFLNTIQSSYVIYSLGLDFTLFDRNWVTTANSVVFHHGYTVNWFPILSISNNMFVPVNPNIVYVKNYGTVKLFNNRFGGENITSTLVENHAGNQHLSLNNELVRGIWISGNEIYNQAQIVNFYRIPGTVYIRGNFYGTTLMSYGAPTLRFDSTIPDSDYQYHTGFGIFDVDSWLLTPSESSTKDNKPQTFAQLPSLRKTSNNEKSVSDLVLAYEEESGGIGEGGNGTGLTIGYPTDKYGNLGAWYAYSGTSPNVNYRYYTTVLTPLTPGRFYTLVFNTIVNSINNIGIQIQVGLSEIHTVLHPGENATTIPFYYNGTDNAVWYNFLNLVSGDNVSVFRFYVWDGIKDQSEHRIVVSDNAAPTSSTGKINWSVGDIVWNTGADNVILWKCTVKGAPGTWVSLSAP